MAWGAKVLQTKAKKFEVKKLKDFEVNKERVLPLEPLLQEVYANKRPKPVEYEVRRNLVGVFNEMAKEIYGNSKDIPVVVEFGSFVMDLFSTTSDLDLSINFNTTAVDFPRQRKIQTLRKFAKKLYAIQSKGHVSGVLPITTAKVPIVKCVDRGTGVECDISVENRDGILKSQIIHIISSIDERFHKLSFLMKTWAKAHNINSSKDKTLNSLSIILLVAFHLQTRDPPILPPFSAIFKDGTDPAIVTKSVSNFVNYGKRNEESLAELFVTLLIKVEDFTDKTQNVARAVGQAEVKQIYKCIDMSIQHIFSFMDGNSEIKLRDLLFGIDGIPTLIPRGPNSKGIAASRATKKTKKSLTGKRKNKVTPSVEQAPAKRKLTAEGWRSIPQGSQNATKPFDAAKRTQPMGGTQITTLPFDPTKGTQPTVVSQPPLTGGRGAEVPLVGGRGGAQPPAVGGRGEAHPPAAGGRGGSQPPAAGGWGGVQLPAAGGRGVAQPPAAGGWGATQQHSAGGWGATQQPSGGGWTVNHRVIAGGWESTHKPNKGSWANAQQPNRGGWAVNQPERGVWGVNQRPDIEGWTKRSDFGGWAQRSDTGGWTVNQRTDIGGWAVNQRSDIGGWAVNQGPDWGGWAQRPDRGDWTVTQHPNMGGWGGVGKHSGRGWGETSDPRWREAPSDSGLWRHKW